jgi:YYY domain-containing protein
VKEVVEQNEEAAARRSLSVRDKLPLRSPLLSKALFPLLLAIVLLGGFTLRFWGVSWDSYTHLHPDERFITMVADGIKLPSSPGQYFNSDQSPMSPYNREGGGGFAYGTFPLFLTKVTGEVLQHQDFFPLNLLKDGLAKAYTGKVTTWNDYDHIDLIGRTWSALFATGTVLMVFFTGKLLYDRRVGLLAAALMATSVLDIQLAHYFTVDSFLTFFAAFTIYYCVRIVKRGKWSDYVLAGLGLGLATACKLSGAFLAPIVGIAFLWHLWPAITAMLAIHSSPQPPPPPADSEGHEQAAKPPAVDWLAQSAMPVFGICLAVLTAFITFRITEPYAFTGPHFWNVGIDKRYLDDMRSLIGLQSGGNVPFNWEWVGRAKYLFPLKNIVLWGMGLPLGIAACAAFVWAAYRLLRRREATNLLLIIWIAFYFLFWGRQFNMTMRYFLPIYPALVLLAAQALDGIWRFAGSEGMRALMRRFGERALTAGPIVLKGGVVAVVGGTALWALAFTNIYRHPLSRVAASAWMDDNLPVGSTITHEVWDDTVPFALPGKPANFKILDIEPYGADLSDPTSKLLSQISQADYLVLSSNRLYASIPRAPAHWPLTSAFYKLLLDDKLPGFKLVRTFSSYPSLFGININDDSAEGNFTVYDHPKVLLYQKTADYTPAALMASVESAACGATSVSTLVPANAAQNALMLRPADCATQRAGGTWTSIFSPTSLSNRFPAVTWLLAIELMSLAVLPLGLFLFRALPDRGYLLAKPLGLLAVSWLVWLGASLKLFEFTRETIFAMLVVLIVVGAVVARLTRGDMMAFVREHWRRILMYETLFIAAFLVFYWIRVLDPDLWHPSRGGEKPMDFAYLNAVVRSTTMPPYDPWFAGGYMNYYYFGQFMTATLIKLTGILPEVAFNLAVPLFFAMTAGAAFTVVYNLTEATRRRVRWRPGFKRISGSSSVLAGILGVVLLGVIGNLGGLSQMAQRYSTVSDLHVGSGVLFVSGVTGMFGGIWNAIFGGVHVVPFDYWAPSRMMPPQSAITEFPFFTFLFADLHAHLMAIPFDVVILGIGLTLVLGDRRSVPDPRQRQLISWLGVGLLGLVVGALRPINSWDYPPFLLISIIVVFIAERADAGRMDWKAARMAVAKSVVLAALSVLLFYPFWQNYSLFYKGFHASTQTTPFHQYLSHFGILLFASATLVVALSRRFFRRRPGRRALLYLGTLAVLLIVLCGAFALAGESKHLPITFKGLDAGSFLTDLFTNNIPVVAFSMAAIALVGVLAWQELRSRRSDAPMRLFLLAMIALALALSAMVDLITLDGDIDRMNTVFKFYIHIWILLALAGAFGIWYALAVLGWRPRMPGGKGTAFGILNAGWLAALVILVGGGLIYPIAGTQARVDTSERFPQYTSDTNDGMDYMQYAVYADQGGQIELSYDYQAIQWMRQNVQGSPVIVEGVTPNYRWGSRFSIYTGLPTVVGWDWHQEQQRGAFADMVTARETDVKNFYSGTSIAAADAFLSKYNVKYIIVGQVEELYYPSQGLGKFQAMAGRELDLVYQNDKVQIYEVVDLPPLMPSVVAPTS